MTEDDNKAPRKFRATTPGKRFLKLAGMSASIATSVAGNKVKGLFTEEKDRARQQEALYTQIGSQLAETLGEMKGAVMKMGQFASQVQDLFPPEIAEALKKLQKDSPPMPYAVIRSQIIRALGDTPEALFASFETEPFAAASIGQVHRAVTQDGKDCIVKIQYPGVKDSCDSDLKHLRRALKLAGLMKVNADAIDRTFAEIRRMLYEELDYQHEADNVRMFQEYYRDHPYVIVPELVESLCAETVLTLTYVPGDAMSEVSAPTYDQDTINTIGERIFEMFGDQIFNLKAVHSDPHPGNFAFRPDGRIVMYDFGAVKHLPEETVNKLRRLTADAINDRLDNIDEHLRAIGARTADGSPLGIDFYRPWVDILVKPFKSYEPLDFTVVKTHQEIIKKIRRDGLKHVGSFQPAPEVMFVNRVIVGHYWTMVNLGVTASFRPFVDEIVLRKPAANS